MNATRRFAHWYEARSIRELAAVEPSHVAAFIKQIQSKLTPPTVKHPLVALRMLFDWLVLGHVKRRNQHQHLSPWFAAGDTHQRQSSAGCLGNYDPIRSIMTASGPDSRACRC